MGSRERNSLNALFFRAVINSVYINTNHVLLLLLQMRQLIQLPVAKSGPLLAECPPVLIEHLPKVTSLAVFLKILRTCEGDIRGQACLITAHIPTI